MAWWFDHKGFDPTESANILCQDNVTRNLPRICGKRDVNPGDVSPGNILYNSLPTLRTTTKNIIDSCTSGSSVPTNLVATPLGCPNNEVQFTWQNSGTGWYIQVSTSSSFPLSSTYIKWVSGLTTYTGPSGFVLQSDGTTPLGSFLSNTLYYWRIYYGSGNYTTTKTFTTPNCNPPNVTVNANPSTICSGQSTTLTASGSSTYSWSHSLGSGASKTVTPTATTTYSVTGTGSNNATNSALILITVNDCSTTQPTNLSTTLLGCPDNQVTFNWQNSGTGWYIQVSTDPAFPQSNSYIKWVSGLTTYTGPANFVLQSDGITLLDHFLSNTTYYWRIYYGSGNYTTTYSFTTLNCAPQVNLVADPETICNGENSVLTASGADTYEWSHGLGSGNTKTVSPATTTTYTVTGTSGSQSSTTSITITVNQIPSLIVSATPNELCLGGSSILNVSGANSYIWSNGLGSNSTVNVTPSTSTIYSVTGTTNDCSSSATIFVEVLQPPTIGTATINTNIICQNDTITLTLSNYSINDILQWQMSTNGIEWFNIPSANVSPFNYPVTATGNVYFTAQITNNCGSVLSNILTILSNPIPNTPIINQIDSNPIILQSNAPIGNQWYKNNNPIPGATNQTYIVTDNGTYHTIVTINGCSSLPSNQITINNVGINDYSDDEIFIYPNPAQDIIYIQSNTPIIEANIINNLGQLVATSELSNFIEVHNLSNGIYQLIIKTNDNIVVKPILISK
ncbi:MAG: T9SS type A sorting domain-containing protein [Bacteroidales bacterium]